MSNIFIISDHHIDHENILTFTLPDGRRMRTFDTLAQMQDAFLTAHNAVVRPSDKAYFLGDFAIKRAGIAMARLFNGHKRLIRGNHDIYPTKYYAEVFEEIYGVRVFADMILSHIPLHQESIKPRWLANVHGHLHNNQPQGHLGPRYYNVSAEMLNYAPIALEDLRVILRRQHEVWQERQAALEQGVFV